MAVYLAVWWVVKMAAWRVHSQAASMVEWTDAYSVGLSAVSRVEWWDAWMAASMELLSAALMAE